MYKKVLNICFCVVFILCISLPLVFTNLKDNVVSESENRYLTGKPSLYTEEGTLNTRFLTDFESWFNDNVGFRGKMVIGNACIQYGVFKNAANSNVIVGKNGWLFYNSITDGNPMANYLGTDLYSAEELEMIANNLCTTKDYLQAQGTEFVLFIAPNKERVYSEYMPAYYGNPAEEYKIKQVIEYLRKNTDIRIVYPYDALMKQKESNPNLKLYYPLDTHWNPVGAYVGTIELMEELDIEMANLEDLSIDRTGASSYDLAGMLNLAKYLNKESGYVLSGYETGQPDNRKIFMVRDSFGYGMVDYIESQVDECYSVHVDSFSQELYEQEGADVFVYEMVERYSFRLLGFRLE